MGLLLRWSLDGARWAWNEKAALRVHEASPAWVWPAATVVQSSTRIFERELAK